MSLFKNLLFAFGLMLVTSLVGCGGSSNPTAVPQDELAEFVAENELEEVEEVE